MAGRGLPIDVLFQLHLTMIDVHSQYLPWMRTANKLCQQRRHFSYLPSDIDLSSNMSKFILLLLTSVTSTTRVARDVNGWCMHVSVRPCSRLVHCLCLSMNMHWSSLSINLYGSYLCGNENIFDEQLFFFHGNKKIKHYCFGLELLSINVYHHHRLYIPVILLYLSIVAIKNILLQGQQICGVWNYW